MKFYISGGAIVLLLVLYTPLVLFLLWKTWRALPPKRAIRVSAVVGGLVIAAALPLYDVIITSTKMAKLCPDAGIKIRRSVHVDGFYTNLGGADDLKRGFKYVEVKSANTVSIYTKVGDEIQMQRIDTDKTQYVPRSRYEFIYDSETGAVAGYPLIGIQKSVVRDHVTSEELGSSVRYGAYPGWVDQSTIGLFGRFTWNCPDAPDQDVKLLRQVILPTN